MSWKVSKIYLLRLNPAVWRLKENKTIKFKFAVKYDFLPCIMKQQLKLAQVMAKPHPSVIHILNNPKNELKHSCKKNNSTCSFSSQRKFIVILSTRQQKPFYR